MKKIIAKKFDDVKTQSSMDVVTELLNLWFGSKQDAINDPENRIYRHRWSEQRQAKKQARLDSEIDEMQEFVDSLDEARVISYDHGFEPTLEVAKVEISLINAQKMQWMRSRK